MTCHAPKLRRRSIRRGLVLITAFVAGSLALAAPAAAVDSIDPHVDPSVTQNVTATEGSTELTNFGSPLNERAREEKLLGFAPETDEQTGEEVRSNEDYCLWVGLLGAAYDLSNGNSNSPMDALSAHLLPCLGTHFSGSASDLSSLARFLMAESAVHIVQSQSPSLSVQGAVSWLENNSLDLDPSTWSSWFTFMANQLPPSGSV